MLDTRTKQAETGDAAEGAGRFLDGHLLSLIARAAHGASAEFHSALRRAGVPVPVWQVLAALQGVEDDTVTGLAGACLLQQPTMTKLLDRMVRDGLVMRVPDPRDRRVVRIRPTDRGRTMLNDLLPLARRHEEEVLSRLPADDAARIKRLLRAIIAEGERARRGRRRPASPALLGGSPR